MGWGGIVALGAGYGLVLSLLLSVVLGVGVLLGRDFMVQDYPPAIKARYGPKSARGRTVSYALAPLFLAAVIVVLVLAMLRLRTAAGGDIGFGPAFLAAAVVLLTFNLYDLLVIDWLVFAWLRPGFVVLPGTEGMAEYGDLRFHAVESAKGVVICLVAAALAAGITVAVQAVT